MYSERFRGYWSLKGSTLNLARIVNTSFLTSGNLKPETGDVTITAVTITITISITIALTLTTTGVDSVHPTGLRDSQKQ